MKNRFEFVPGIQHGEVRINNMGIEQFHPHSSLKDLGFEQEEFVKEANYLLDKYKIKVPDDFPKPVETNQALFGEKPMNVYHIGKVGVCFCNCIELERKHNINTSKLLSELIKPDPVAGLLHSTSISTIALDYLDKGYKVELFQKTQEGKEPDLLVHGIFCDVKVITESDWTKEALKKDEEGFRATGMEPPHYIRDDICFDIGTFIRNKGSKGIQQAEMLLVDLSLKSLPDLRKCEGVQQQILPPPKSNRIVFFCCPLYERKVDSAYYLDFDQLLWEAIRNCDERIQRGWLPPPAGWADSANKLRDS